MVTVHLDDASIREIAARVRDLVASPKQENEEELVTTQEAARILRISSDRMRRLKDKFPHVKAGKNGKLLFVKRGLVENYTT